MFHIIPVTIMSFAFACTRVIPSKIHSGGTLFWGGDFTDWPFLMIQIGAILHSGLVAYVFYLLMPRRVALVHLVTLGLVVSTLLLTEHRMDLGSKWCTYCLIYSIVYVAEPLWLKNSESTNLKNSKKD